MGEKPATKTVYVLRVRPVGWLPLDALPDPPIRNEVEP